MATMESPNTDDVQVLSSQKLLDQSIQCINKGIEFENNKELDAALAIYEVGMSLLIQANEIETNNDVIPIITENLKSIQKRIDSVQEQCEFDNMIKNLQKMQQKSIDLFQEQNLLIPDADINESDPSINTNEDSIDDVDADTMLNNLYQQYYGANYDQIDIKIEDELNEISLNETDELSTEHKSDHISTHCIIKYEIGQALIGPIPNEICGYIFEYISGQQLTKLFIISKYWSHCLLYDPTFHHLWKRIIIGADPIRNSLGHNLKLNWCKTATYGAAIRQHMETLIISTAGLALDELLKSTPDSDIDILREFEFPKLKVCHL